MQKPPKYLRENLKTNRFDKSETHSLWEEIPQAEYKGYKENHQYDRHDKIGKITTFELVEEDNVIDEDELIHPS